MQRGYDRALCILPFDHRGSFQAKMFGWKSPLSETQTTEISRAKEVIYDGFKAALSNGVPKEKTGNPGRREIRSKNIITACPAEKSGPVRDIIPQGGLTHAARYDRSRPHGRQYGPATYQGRPSMRGFRRIAEGGRGFGA
jgi:hypothetical protein